jgi:hypothetical protein
MRSIMSALTGWLIYLADLRRPGSGPYAIQIMFRRSRRFDSGKGQYMEPRIEYSGLPTGDQQ